MFIVYKHTCSLNSKSYVGITPKSAVINASAEELMEKRWNGHCYSAFNRGSDLVFHKAIRKHGVENFTHEILQICDSLESVLEAEIFWIETLKCTIDDHGYNMTRGGEGNLMTDTVKEKHRLATSIGTKLALADPIVKQRHAIANKLSWESEDRRNKNSEAQKIAQSRKEVKLKKSVASAVAWKISEKLNSRKKKIKQLDLQGNLITVFESARQAARELNLSQGAISNVARGIAKSTGGYLWQYENDIDTVKSYVSFRGKSSTTGTKLKKKWKEDEEFRQREIKKRQGKNNSSAKLSEEIIRQIRLEFQQVDVTKFGEKSIFYRCMSKRYSVTPELVCGIVRRTCWKHV